MERQAGAGQSISSDAGSVSAQPAQVRRAFRFLLLPHPLFCRPGVRRRRRRCRCLFHLLQLALRLLALLRLPGLHLRRTVLLLHQVAVGDGARLRWAVAAQQPHSSPAAAQQPSSPAAQQPSSPAAQQPSSPASSRPPAAPPAAAASAAPAPGLRLPAAPRAPAASPPAPAAAAACHQSPWRAPGLPPRACAPPRAPAARRCSRP